MKNTQFPDMDDDLLAVEPGLLPGSFPFQYRLYPLYSYFHLSWIVMQPQPLDLGSDDDVGVYVNGRHVILASSWGW